MPIDELHRPKNNGTNQANSMIPTKVHTTCNIIQIKLKEEKKEKIRFGTAVNDKVSLEFFRMNKKEQNHEIFERQSIES